MLGLWGLFLFLFSHHVPWSSAAWFSQKMFIFIESSLSLNGDRLEDWPVQDRCLVWGCGFTLDQ